MRHAITYHSLDSTVVTQFHVHDWMSEDAFAFTDEEWTRLKNSARPLPEAGDLPGDVLRRLTAGLQPDSEDHWSLHPWIRPPRYPHHVAVRCRDDFQIAHFRHLYLPGELETMVFHIEPETDYDIGMTFRCGAIHENPFKPYPTRLVYLIDFIVGFPHREVADRFREAIADNGN